MTRAKRLASVGIVTLRTKLIRAGKLGEKEPLGPEYMALLESIAAMIDHSLNEN